MQIAALNALKSIRNENKNKALLISATGTGKTYLSAFDVKAFNPKRMLFVVHRENICLLYTSSFIAFNTSSLNPNCSNLFSIIVYTFLNTLVSIA